MCCGSRVVAMHEREGEIDRSADGAINDVRRKMGQAGVSQSNRMWKREREIAPPLRWKSSEVRCDEQDQMGGLMIWG